MKTLTFQASQGKICGNELLGSAGTQVSSRRIVMLCPSPSLCSCWIAADPEHTSFHLLVGLCCPEKQNIAEIYKIK